VTPLLVRASASTFASIFLVSSGSHPSTHTLHERARSQSSACCSGLLTLIDADGRTGWTLSTQASWRTAEAGFVDAARAPLLPSLTQLEQPGAPPLIVAAGDQQLVVASASGALLDDVSLPSTPVAPPIVADFDGDGHADLIVPVLAGYVGIRVTPSVGSLLLQLLFGFLTLAVVLVIMLRHSIPKRAEPDP